MLVNSARLGRGTDWRAAFSVQLTGCERHELHLSRRTRETTQTGRQEGLSGGVPVA